MQWSADDVYLCTYVLAVFVVCVVLLLLALVPCLVRTVRCVRKVGLGRLLLSKGSICLSVSSVSQISAPLDRIDGLCTHSYTSMSVCLSIGHALFNLTGPLSVCLICHWLTWLTDSAVRAVPGVCSVLAAGPPCEVRAFLVGALPSCVRTCDCVCVSMDG